MPPRRKIPKRKEDGDAKVTTNFPLTKLPEEILLHVFHVMTIDERKNASLVCKAWYSLLSLPRFSEDCPLTIRTCYISSKCPPLSVLMETKRPFHHVVFAEEICWMSQDETDQFIDKIGSGVQSVIFTGSVEHDTDNQSDKTIKRGFLGRFVNLKEVKVKTLADAFFLGISDSVKRIHVHSFEVSMPFHIVQEMEIWKKAGRFLSCNKVDFGKREEGPDDILAYAKVDEKLQKLLGHYELTSFLCPLSQNLLNVTEFGLKELSAGKFCFTMVELAVFKDTLKDCSNLARLALIVDPSTCFFYHEKMNLNHVHTVALSLPPNTGKTIVCKDCLHWLNQSCPRISSWCVSAQIQNLSTIVNSSETPLKVLHIDDVRGSLVLNMTFPKLELLRIDAAKEVNEKDEHWLTLSYYWQEMPRLRYLHLGSTIAFTNDSLRQLIAKTPNIYSLNINSSASLDMEKLRIIEKGWPHLKHIYIEEITYAHFLKTLPKVLGETNKSLRSFTVKNYCNPREEREIDVLYDLFEKIPTLRDVLKTNYLEYCQEMYEMPKFAVDFMEFCSIM